GGVVDRDAAHGVMALVGYAPTGEGVWEPDGLSALEGRGVGGELVFFFAGDLFVGIDGAEPEVNDPHDGWNDNAAQDLTIVGVEGSVATVRYQLFGPGDPGAPTGESVEVDFVLDQVPI